MKEGTRVSGVDRRRKRFVMFDETGDTTARG
jgi:hypothetical protein